MSEKVEKKIRKLYRKEIQTEQIGQLNKMWSGLYYQKDRHFKIVLAIAIISIIGNIVLSIFK